MIEAAGQGLAMMEAHAMQHYVGLDVSLKQTAVCVQTGKIKREGMVASDPDAIARFIAAHAPHVARIGLETGTPRPP